MSGIMNPATLLVALVLLLSGSAGIYSGVTYVVGAVTQCAGNPTAPTNPTWLSLGALVEEPWQVDPVPTRCQGSFKWNLTRDWEEGNMTALLGLQGLPGSLRVDRLATARIPARPARLTVFQITDLLVDLETLWGAPAHLQRLSASGYTHLEPQIPEVSAGPGVGIMYRIPAGGPAPGSTDLATALHAYINSGVDLVVVQYLAPTSNPTQYLLYHLELDVHLAPSQQAQVHGWISDLHFPRAAGARTQ